MNTCKMCRDRGKTWEGSNPTCYFIDPKNNWNCATVNAIRDICYEGQNLPHGVQYMYCDDEKYATIKIPDGSDIDALCLWVQWYKNRGGTGSLFLLDSYNPPREPTEGELLDIIDAYK